MFILRLILILLLTTSVVNAREIKISQSIDGKSQKVQVDENHNGKDFKYIQKVGTVDITNPSTLVTPVLPSEEYRSEKFIGGWRDLYNLSQDALKKNIIQGTAVDYFEHNNERFQRTLKWQGTDEFNFSLTINIDKQ